MDLKYIGFVIVDNLDIYAASVASIVFLWDVFKFRADRRKIIIYCELLDTDYAVSKYNKTKKWVNPLRIFVTNRSNQNCTIQSFSYFYNTLQESDEYLNRLPQEVAPGSCFTFEFNMKNTKEHIPISLCKYIQIKTSDGKIWESKIYPFYDGNILKRSILRYKEKKQWKPILSK